MSSRSRRAILWDEVSEGLFMAIFRKTTPREMKWRMIIFSAFFFVMMAVTTWMGVRSTGMMFFWFGVLAAGLAVFWAVREARDKGK